MKVYYIPWKSVWKYEFEKIHRSTFQLIKDRLYFYRTYGVNLWEKKVWHLFMLNKCFYRTWSFYEKGMETVED